MVALRGHSDTGIERTVEHVFPLGSSVLLTLPVPCCVCRAVCAVQATGAAAGLQRSLCCYSSCYLVLDLSVAPWRIIHMNQPAVEATGGSVICFVYFLVFVCMEGHSCEPASSGNNSVAWERCWDAHKLLVGSISSFGLMLQIMLRCLDQQRQVGLARVQARKQVGPTLGFRG